MSDETKRKIRDLVRQDPHYPAQAYYFTLEALSYSLEELKKSGQEGHIDGVQLLFGMRDYGRRLFGYLGAAVLREWRVSETSDFGEIVFRLVEAELLSKQESDTREDFDSVFDLKGAFEETFLYS